MRYMPYDPDFDAHALNPFEAEKARLFDTGLTLDKDSGTDSGTQCHGTLVLRGFDQDAAEATLARHRPRHLLLAGGKITSLACLDCLPDLKTLALMDLPRLETLASADCLRSLETLIVESCSRLLDISALCAMPHLQTLRLSGPALGGGWKKIALQPLKTLHSLRNLSLAGLRTPDESLDCFHALPALETLELDGAWPARELARVAALQPHLVRRATFLKPLVASAHGSSMSFFDVNPAAYPVGKISYMASGKRRPSDLRPGRDDRKIGKITREWQAWVEEFSSGCSAP